MGRIDLKNKRMARRSSGGGGSGGNHGGGNNDQKNINTPTKAFNALLKNVEPTPEEKREATKINRQAKEDIEKIFDLDKNSASYLIGSKKENTQISPVNDIDRVMILDSNQYGFLANNLKNPELTLNYVAKSLEKEYSETLEYCKANENAVTLKYKDSDLPVDVVVGFVDETADNPHQILIPDTKSGTFIKTNPKFNQRILMQENIKTHGKLKPEIKKTRKILEDKGIKMNSTFLKQKLAKQTRYGKKSELGKMAHNFEKLCKDDLKPIENPGVMGGKIDSGVSNRVETVKALKEVRDGLKEALRYEKAGNKEKSLEKVKETLGENFYE